MESKNVVTRLSPTLAIPFLLALAVCGPPAAAAVRCVTAGTAGLPYRAGVNCRTVIVNGYTREYFVYVPVILSQSRHGVPAVLAYHASGGSGRRFLSTSGWTAKADAEGFVAVFQSALPYFELKSGGQETLFNTWVDDDAAALDVDIGVRPPDYPSSEHWPADDLAFTDAVIDDLIAANDADPARVYAAGFSNGGVFAMRLALDRTDRIAAVGSYEGELRTTGPAPANPIPVLYAIGTIIDGQSLPLDAEALLAEPDIAAKVATLTSAFSLRSEIYQARELRWQTRISFTEPAADTPTSILGLLVLDGVAHEWPVRTNNPHHFSGTRELWKFFRHFAKH